jgi:NADH-ubiquinone oxidoreductase chain 4
MIVSFGSQPERLRAGAYLLFYTTRVSIPYIGIILFIKINQSTFWINKVTVGRRIMVFVITIPFLVKIPVFGLHF